MKHEREKGWKALKSVRNTEAILRKDICLIGILGEEGEWSSRRNM